MRHGPWFVIAASVKADIALILAWDGSWQRVTHPFVKRYRLKKAAEERTRQENSSWSDIHWKHWVATKADLDRLRIEAEFSNGR